MGKNKQEYYYWNSLKVLNSSCQVHPQDLSQDHSLILQQDLSRKYAIKLHILSGATVPDTM